MRGSAVLFSLVLATAAPAWGADTLTVRMDQNAALRLAAPARSVVVGNPAIADVTMLDARSLVVVGKAFGVTNLLVMDGGGRTILNRQVVVTASDASMTYFKGGKPETYACAERCEPVAAPGAAPSPAP